MVLHRMCPLQPAILQITLKDEVPSVEAICRFYDEGLMEVLIERPKPVFPTNPFLWADAGVFSNL
jgi:hypothetical protein